MEKETSIDISKKDKAEVLAALYNGSKAQGLGFLHYDSKFMEKEEAAQLIADSGDETFDYIKGRIIKIKLGHNIVRTTLYNRDVGKNAAELIINDLPDYDE